VGFLRVPESVTLVLTPTPGIALWKTGEARSPHAPGAGVERESAGGVGRGTGGDAGSLAWAGVRATLGRCALALCRDADEAEELTHEAIVRLIERGGEHATHEGYAVQTLTRVWLTRQRRLRARASRLKAIALDRASRAPGIAPSDRGDGDGVRGRDIERDIERKIERVVATLAPVQRSVLVLRTVMGMTTTQVAHALEMDEGSVRSALHLARRAVRRRMGDGS